MGFIEIARILFALFAVIAMIGLVAIAAKRLGLANGALSLQRPRRLLLVETLPLDPRRRAAILSCDGREHLIVLDPGRVTVIEQGLPSRPNCAGETHSLEPASPIRKLGVPPPVVRLLQRGPRDVPMAFRSAGIL